MGQGHDTGSLTLTQGLQNKIFPKSCETFEEECITVHVHSTKKVSTLYALTWKISKGVKHVHLAEAHSMECMMKPE